MSDWKELVAQKLKNSRSKAVRLDVENETVAYADDIVKPKIEKFKPEEIVRAFLVDRLVNELGYSEKNIELEKHYKRDSIGREKEKLREDSARIDVIVRDKDGNPFLFIEVKAPKEFDRGEDDIKGQLFELSDLETKQNKTKVKYLVYYSIDTSLELADRLYLIEKDECPEYEDWKPLKDKTYGLEIPYNYGKPKLKIRAKDEKDTALRSISEQKMSELRTKIHNTLWSSGVEDNEAYIFLVKFLLTKIYDEDETVDGEKYRCQIFDKDFEDEPKFFARVNQCYKDALRVKLNYSDEDIKNIGNILTTEKVSVQSLYFLVKELQDYSFSKSIRNQKKDILGHFFEETNREKFKQSKGQFFTTTSIVDFLVYALQIDRLAISRFESDYTLPYIIDPSAGSGTFLIEAMKIITKEFSKHKFALSNEKKSRLKKLFPDDKPNDWAEHFIYGIDNSYSLTISTKVNMILHGDGSSNTFKDDGLKNLQAYARHRGTKLAHYETGKRIYTKAKSNIGVNEQFDVVISNPPFSVNINTAKDEVNKYFLFGSKKNSENLFIERFYQLLKEGGRLGVVLPESVFDTTENKYIRLFLFKYFHVKAVVSLPQITFEPFTSTKTSLLLAQKKTTAEVERWNELWDEYGGEWSLLKTRLNDYVQYFVEEKPLNKKWAADVVEDIESGDERKILQNIHRFLKDYLTAEDEDLSVREILAKYANEIKDLMQFEKESEIFGFYNAWWVFGEVASRLSEPIFMAEAENVGYKRTKKGENPMPNDLFDVEYAPNELDTGEILREYAENIEQAEHDRREIEEELTKLETRAEARETKTTTDKIEKAKRIIENYRRKIERLTAERAEAAEIFAEYYADNRLKNEYYERDDRVLTNHFKNGILKPHRSDDVLLRRELQKTILDSIRKAVVWA